MLKESSVVRTPEAGRKTSIWFAAAATSPRNNEDQKVDAPRIVRIPLMLVLVVPEHLGDDAITERCGTPDSSPSSALRSVGACSPTTITVLVACPRAAQPSCVTIADRVAADVCVGVRFARAGVRLEESPECGSVVSDLHVVEAKAEGVVPLDAFPANVEETETEIREAGLSNNARLTPRVIAVAIGERQGPVRLDSVEVERLPVPIPSHNIRASS